MQSKLSTMHSKQKRRINLCMSSFLPSSLLFVIHLSRSHSAQRQSTLFTDIRPRGKRRDVTRPVFSGDSGGEGGEKGEGEEVGKSGRGGRGGEEREGRGVSGSILPPFLPLPRNLIRTRFITREMQELRGLDKECCLGLCSGLEIWLLLLSLLFVPFVVVSRMLR